MNRQQNAGSLKLIFHGFRRITKQEQIEYLKYLSLVIEKQNNKREKRTLLKFKIKLEREIKKQLADA